MTETKQNTETIENKIKELNNEIKYEEERLKQSNSKTLKWYVK